MIKNKQAEENKRWESKNKEYSNYLKQRTTSRSFIKNKATEQDIEEFRVLLEEREKNLGLSNK